MADWEEALSQTPVLQSLIPRLDRAAALALFAVSRRLRSTLAADGDLRGMYFEQCAHTFRRMLCDVAAWGDLPAMRSIFSRRAAEIQGAPRGPDDPLMLEAARQGYIRERYLAAMDPSPGYTALSFAARAGHVDMMRFLLEEVGILPTIITQILAIEGGSLAAVQTLSARMLPDPSGHKIKTTIAMEYDHTGIMVPREMRIQFNLITYSVISELKPSHFDIHAWLLAR